MKIIIVDGDNNLVAKDYPAGPHPDVYFDDGVRLDIKTVASTYRPKMPCIVLDADPGFRDPNPVKTFAQSLNDRPPRPRRNKIQRHKK
jgi:hypothetical protein